MSQPTDKASFDPIELDRAKLVRLHQEMQTIGKEIFEERNALQKQLGPIGLMIAIDGLNGKLSIINHFLNSLGKIMGIAPPTPHGHEHESNIEIPLETLKNMVAIAEAEEAKKKEGA